jgi:hypothetical protein
MSSVNCDLAVEHCHKIGNALLKFVSANDVNATGAHQTGFYLPKSDHVWQLFTDSPPVKGSNHQTPVSIFWQEESRMTRSIIYWYGKQTRSEYRLTRFGRGFPYLSKDAVGSLLVLIPLGGRDYRAFLLDSEDDIEEIQAALGVQIGRSWAIFQGGLPKEESEDECIERQFQELVESLAAFPSGEVFSKAARRIIRACIRHFEESGPDVVLVRWMASEYHLFRMAERALCTKDVTGNFRDIDDFLRVASAIMNRRKSRAGRSLENHVEALLSATNIPHVMRTCDIDGTPDIVIPSVEAYNDPAYPTEKLFVVGVKTTCKDRWRQVLHEARRVQHKHILTMQPGISSKQLKEMKEAQVSLIVPASLHKEFPRDSSMKLLTVEGFLGKVSDTLRM